MRIVKDYEERRKEILDITEKLFITKGYSKTTINDILKEVGIAKGTFYHYFKSKEEVLDSMINRMVENEYKVARSIANNKEITPPEKIFKILTNDGKSSSDIKKEVINELHSKENLELHIRTLIESISKLSPVMGEIVEEGIENNIFKTKFPQEYIEFLLILGQIMFDGSFFKWGEEELVSRVKAFENMMELLLGAEKGAFKYITDILSKDLYNK